MSVRAIATFCVAVAMATDLSACASAQNASGGTPASPTAASPAPASAPGPGASSPLEPLSGSGSPVAIERGRVVVTLDASAYTVGRVIRATVANGLDRTIYAEDSKTGCTLGFLQRLEAGAWSDITGCGLGRPPATAAIGPGLGRVIVLDPSSFLFDVTPGPAFGAGTYRVKFTYGYDAGDESQTAYSAQFSVR
jgi:hypothetical protein